MKKSIIVFLSFFLSIISFSQKEDIQLYWIGTDTSCGYVNSQGDTIIPVDSYLACLNDTISDFGLVLTNDYKWIGINGSNTNLFEVFIYDNGPDYVKDGLFRIVENKKIGFANTDGEVVIQPQFDAAFPFENGVAEVGKICSKETHLEHWNWICQEWFYLDKEGNLTPKE